MSLGFDRAQGVAVDVGGCGCVWVKATRKELKRLMAPTEAEATWVAPTQVSSERGGVKEVGR